MKALTILQPYATLAALEVKTIETRPSPPNGDMRPDGVRGLPGLGINRGERIAIHAAASRPQPGMLGGYCVEHWWDEIRHCVECDCDDGVGPSCGRRSPSRMVLTLDETLIADLTLGAVVATAVVADALPIEAPCSINDLRRRRIIGTHLWIVPSTDRLSTVEVTNRSFWSQDDITDQLPLGDFTPGRWGWILTDVEPLPEPIPARGKQGVWEWTGPRSTVTGGGRRG